MNGAFAITFFEPGLFVYFCGDDKSKSLAGSRRQLTKSTLFKIMVSLHGSYWLKNSDRERRNGIASFATLL
ncbi:MAG: hypothetical protein IPP49_07720 [Saprospiraceae bacterium]|nr:hypothetical protein [Saprospiraceae bacterium]